MCSDDIAIKVSNVSKHYHIYERPLDRLKQSFFHGRKTFYREFKALDSVSFEVKKGETIGVIGRNGAGKSTLLQMICGTLTPSSGDVIVNGRVAALLELGAGFNSEFTGRENVYMNASILGLNKLEIDDKYDDIVDFADIGEYIDQPVKTFSSGMYVRLAFAIIAHVDADILIIDEALSVGDAFFVQKCMRFLRNFMKNGTVLFVSHDTGAVLNLCDSAIWLDAGVVRETGAPKEVSELYLEALYNNDSFVDDTVQDIDDDIMQTCPSEDYRDMRLDFINSTNLRNDIELFKFDDSLASFGDGGARVKLVRLLDQNGAPLSWVVGGERVTLEVICKANADLYKPIVGFFVRDKLGQSLFGDNTFIEYLSKPVHVKSGNVFSARFNFVMPVLVMGDYSITVSIAEGTQEEHIQHHWVHDALVLVSHASSVCQGLVGVPMRKIEIQVIES